MRNIYHNAFEAWPLITYSDLKSRLALSFPGGSFIHSRALLHLFYLERVALYYDPTMRPKTLMIFFLFLVSLVSAAPITTRDDSHLDTVFYGIISGSSPYTTRFSTQIHSVPLKKRLQQRLKKEKRRTEQLLRWMWSYIEAAQEHERWVSQNKCISFSPNLLAGTIYIF